MNEFKKIFERLCPTIARMEAKALTEQGIYFLTCWWGHRTDVFVYDERELLEDSQTETL